jgi:hypothetical protein
MTLNVYDKLCATCVFTKRSPISQERFDELKEIWERDGVQQECHTATNEGKQISCRGHYNAAKHGKVENYPVVNEIRKIFGYEYIDSDTCFTIAERLGLVNFTNIDEVGDKDE